MPVSSTSTDYSGRLKDIYISGVLNPLSPATQVVTFTFGNPTKYIAGVHKLVQRYLISIINSGLIEELLGVASNNIQAAKNLFNVKNLDVIVSFRAYQTSAPSNSIPLDEQLDTVQLLNVVSNGTAITFSAKLSTKVGDSVVFLMPLPLN